MAVTSDLFKIRRTIAFSCGILATLMGLLFLVGYHVNIPILLSLPPSTWAIPYSSSFCLFLSGIALLFMQLREKKAIVGVLGFIVFVISISRLLEFIFSVDLGVTSFFIQEIVKAPPTSMAFIGVVGFMINGLILILWPSKSQTIFYTLTVNFLSIFLFFFGILTLLSNISPLSKNFGVKGITPIHFYTSVSFITIGIGYVLSCINNEYVLLKRKINWLSLFVCIGSMFIFFLVALGVRTEKVTVLQTLLSTEAQNDAHFLETDYANLSRLIARGALRIEYAQRMPDASWSKDISTIIKDAQIFHSIYWMDTNFELQQGVSRIGEPLYVSYGNRFVPFIRSEILSNGPSFSLTDTLVPSEDLKDYDVLVLKPFSWNNTIQGYVVGILDLEMLFSTTILPLIGTDYSVVIKYQDKNIANYNLDLLKVPNLWKIDQNFVLGQNTFTLEISPTLSTLDTQLSNNLILTILITGILFSIVLGIVIYEYQITSITYTDVMQKDELLSAEKANLTNILKYAKMGTWDWDLLSNEVIWDEFTYSLFGLPPKGPLTIQQFTNYVMEEDRAALAESIRLSIEKGAPVSYHYRIRWPNDTIHSLTSKGKLIYNEEGVPIRMKGIVWEVTDYDRSKHYLQISQNIVRIFNEAYSTLAAADNIINYLYLHLGWQVLVIWEWDHLEGKLVKKQIAHHQFANIKDFETKIEMRLMGNGSSLLDQSWAMQQPVKIKNLSSESGYLEEKPFLDLGILSIIAFPVRRKNENYGVIELYKSTPLLEPFDQDFTDLLMSIGFGMGQFLARIAMETDKSELASIVTTSNLGIYSYSLDGTIKSWNNGAERIYGWIRHEMIGKPVTTLYPPERMAEFDTAIQQLLEKKSISNFQTQRITKRGTILWVENNISPIFDDNGNVTGASTIVQDISNQKEMMSQLKTNEEKLRTIIESTDEWIWEMNEKFQITSSNAAIYKVLGYARNEIIGRNILSLIPDENKKKVEEELKQQQNKMAGWSHKQILYRRKDGSTIWMESSAQVIRSDSGDFAGFRGTDRDISEQKNIEISKNEFISMVSHELRTPITSIQGAIGLLRSKKFPEEKMQELFGIALRNTEHLSRIIEYMLDVEKIQMNRFEVPTRPTSLKDAIEQSVRNCKPLCEKYKVEIEPPLDLPEVMVCADLGRLVQVLLNLLSNAIQFSPPGEKVKVSVTVGDKTVRCSIEDHGKGISEAFRAKIFEKFSQEDSSDSRVGPGTGLGLSICKHIISKFGGTIDYVSSSKGTTFFFDLRRCEG